MCNKWKNIPTCASLFPENLVCDILPSKWYLHGNNKFCLGCKMLVGTCTVEAVIEDPQGLHLIFVKRNISYILNYQLLNVTPTWRCPGECAFVKDDGVTVHCGGPSTILTVFVVAASRGRRTSERGPVPVWWRGRALPPNMEGKCVTQLRRLYVIWNYLVDFKCCISWIL